MAPPNSFFSIFTSKSVCLSYSKTKTLIFQKKKAFFEEKLKKNIKNLKKLWKTLKQLGMSNKMSPNKIFLAEKNGLTFDPPTISEVFLKKALRQILKVISQSHFF